MIRVDFLVFGLNEPDTTPHVTAPLIALDTRGIITLWLENQISYQLQNYERIPHMFEQSQSRSQHAANAHGGRGGLTQWTMALAMLLGMAGFTNVAGAAETASRPAGKIVYADNTLSADIKDGTYSAEKRSAGGKDGNAYKTIQDAVYAMLPGDTLLLRGGTFKESNISLGQSKTTQWWKGTPDKWYVIRSYPGEWAVVDGEHREDVDEKGNPRAYTMFYARGDVGYIRLEYFEVRNGGPGVQSKDGRERTGMYDKEIDIPGCASNGFHFWTGHDIVFDHMVIHDNYGGASHLGGAGLAIQNGSGAARNILVDHCWIYRNGWSDGESGMGVRLFADYNHHKLDQVDLNTAMQKNEVRYSLLEKMQNGIYHKAQQFLCLTPGPDIHAGTNMAAKDKGDRHHHNIINDCVGSLFVQQDFVQVYNNVISNCGDAISVGKPPAAPYREPFHAVVYNNTIINSRGGFVFHKGWKAAGCNYLPEAMNYHPHLYLWNNLFIGKQFDTVTATRGPMRIMPRYTKEVGIDMNTLHVDNNLLAATAVGLPVIRLGMTNYTFADYVAKGWATAMWDVSASPLQDGQGPTAFLPKKDATIGGKPFAQAGRGGNHPYLTNVKIPSYLGAVDPADSAWVKEVENLCGLGKSIKAPPLSE